MKKTQKNPVNWKDIKLLILDCDGVLTDGKITYTDEGIEIKNFSAHDGMGFALLYKAGIIPAIITARTSGALQQRCKDLSIKHLFQGVQKKLLKAQKLLDKLCLNWNNVIYMGDDWNDVPVMQKAAFAVCPSDAPEEIQKFADYVTGHKAGDGAVRDCIDYILYQQNIYESVVRKYLDDVSH